MSDVDLAAIRARADAATEGPWEVEYDNNDDYESGIADGDYPYALRGPANITAQSPTVSDSWRENYGHRINELSEMLTPDAEFVAHARADVPALLEALATAQADIAKESQRWDDAMDHIATLQGDLAARDAVIAGIHAIADRERTFSESLSRDFSGNLFPQIVRLDTLRNALAQSPADAPSDALAAAKAEAWDEGVATALNHAIRNPDKVTLRLEHLDGRPWQNPYRTTPTEEATT